MPVESSKGCNTALKSCCSVLVHSAHIDTEPPIFFDVDAKADPFDTTMDRPAMVVKATAAIRALRDAFTLPNDFLLITPLLVVVISFMRPAPLPLKNLKAFVALHDAVRLGGAIHLAPQA